MLAIFPLTSKALMKAPAAKPERREDFTFQQICELATSFSLKLFLDVLAGEWVDFQLDDVGSSDVSPSQFWSSTSTNEHYPLLSELIRVLLCIPHSNAGSERMFSMLKNIITEQKSKLGAGTVNVLLSVKMNDDGCCINH